MRNRFTITESEKVRILGLHEQANPLAQGNALTNSTLNTGNKINVTSTTPKITSTSTPEQQKLIDDANSWVETNKSTIPKTVAEITKFLADKVTAKQLTPESLPYIKGIIQSNSNGSLTFPNEELGGQPAATPAAGAVQPINPRVKTPKIITLQEFLNKNYNAGLNPDGYYGPKTVSALQNAIKTKTQSSEVKTAAATTPGSDVKTDGTSPVATTQGGEVKTDGTVASAPVASAPVASIDPANSGEFFKG